jgi:glycosyltransferase involved in cell wall biosynthesis
LIDVFVITNVYDARHEAASDLLDHSAFQTGWAEGLAAAGARVAVFHRFHRDETVTRGGVSYRLVADPFPPWLRGWQIPRRMHGQLCGAARDAARAGRRAVVHLHGLIFPLQTRHLRRRLPGECGLVVQHHAESPQPGWRAAVQAWGLQHVDAFLFTSRQLAADWIDRGVIRSRHAIYEAMECSSLFTGLDHRSDRSRLDGQPAVLWVGNLTANKDPLTILAGFERVLEVRPAARLYMAYRDATLLGQVQTRLACGPKLSRAVTLLGAVPHSEIGNYFQGADFLVQGSAKEGSGVAVLDALACGAVPVVTDIPSFRTLLDGGRVGALWPVGDERSFAQALLALAAKPLAPQKEAARKHFQQRWTHARIGQRMMEVYLDVVARRSATHKL